MVTATIAKLTYHPSEPSLFVLYFFLFSLFLCLHSAPTKPISMNGLDREGKRAVSTGIEASLAELHVGNVALSH